MVKISNTMIFVLGVSLLFIGAWYGMENPEYGMENQIAGFIILFGIFLVVVSILLARREEKSSFQR